jgi:hypothetical protein
VEVAGAGLAASACIVVCTACAGPSAPPSESPEQQFAANTADLIDRFHEDVTISTAEGASLATARKALRNADDLVAMLIAYADFGGCRKMIRNAGEAGSRFRQVEATLGSACHILERASSLFTDAVTRANARVLFAAAQTTTGALALLYRAKVELDAASPSGR